ncbi:hypothetical protein PFICI_04574 [Pestalotiopsis fici W106-1]|uniref:Bulb-type lectin domain-containing protein n=1 Tax=Pestalotiopsis fici (strain W106-1 / CGMCC3.15140) TaxID=1229662 RepID=W3X9A1_PESFW|nr:uncharacterized protein PFICI_04574 [Pestalotiopsis fici W106-1]ETS82698.1 hypothetical protein PFICI_04574 [Pestalotiopsis fici W106-1]
MRFLTLEDGNLRLTSYYGDFPPYAILSHTWGTNEEEVTFKDLWDGSAQKKKGYRKIEFCARQAAADGLSHFWIDTCCIDKSNSTELSEALNSMFRWYRDAAKCYVYMSDVTIGDNSADDSVESEEPREELAQSAWEPAFRQSRWFTRSWTLQELLAPKSVEFFTSDGHRLGDKQSLDDEIQEVTDIAAAALRGGDLMSFTVEERMSWASRRQATRDEDHAYALLGIFDVYMPPIYGEGRRHALRRLRKEIEEYEREEARYTSSDKKPEQRSQLKVHDQLDSNEMLISPNGRFTFENQDDGNFVLYDMHQGRLPLWASDTCGAGGNRTIVMQDDGNLVQMFVWNRWPIWSTETGGRGNGSSVLVLQDDGNAVILSDGQQIWQTDTKQRSIVEETKPLRAGESLEQAHALYSENKRFCLVMQEDCNLVLYDRHENHRVMWASNTVRELVKLPLLQLGTDGILVISDRGYEQWKSDNTGEGNENSILVVQDDGNVVIYTGDDRQEAIWDTGTWLD